MSLLYCHHGVDTLCELDAPSLTQLDADTCSKAQEMPELAHSSSLLMRCCRNLTELLQVERVWIDAWRRMHGHVWHACCHQCDLPQTHLC